MKMQQLPKILKLILPRSQIDRAEQADQPRSEQGKQAVTLITLFSYPEKQEKLCVQLQSDLTRFDLALLPGTTKTDLKAW
jgi:hypothetical protein